MFLKHDVKEDMKNKNICIMKSLKTKNLTGFGIINYDDIKNYCKNNDYLLIDPSDINEMDLIIILNSCTKFLVSWGSSFFLKLSLFYLINVN